MQIIIKFKLKNYTLLVLILLFFQTSYSQTIIGEITNGNEGIPFASIYVKGSRIGTSADEEGRFVLNYVPKGKQEIVVSAIGYNKHKQSFTIQAGINTYNFVLKESSYKLDQVVVSGTMKETLFKSHQ